MDKKFIANISNAFGVNFKDEEINEFISSSYDEKDILLYILKKTDFLTKNPSLDSLLKSYEEPVTRDAILENRESVSLQEYEKVLNNEIYTLQVEWTMVAQKLIDIESKISTLRKKLS